MQFKKMKYSFIKELEINHSKHFDINISSIYELNIKPNNDEVVSVEMLSDSEELSEDSFKIVFDDLYNKMDIDIKKKKSLGDVSINLYLPEKYINDIELKSKMRLLNIFNVNFTNLEYDGELKYLNVNNSKGKIVLNTTKCDIEANYDFFDGSLEVNTINSTARVKIPAGTNYKTILNGKKNEFVDAISSDDALNIIELNGFNSKLIIIEK